MNLKCDESTVQGARGVDYWRFWVSFSFNGKLIERKLVAQCLRNALVFSFRNREQRLNARMCFVWRIYKMDLLNQCLESSSNCRTVNEKVLYHMFITFQLKCFEIILELV